MGSKRRHNIHSWNVAHIGAQCGMFEGQGFKMLQKATPEEINAQETSKAFVNGCSFSTHLCVGGGFSRKRRRRVLPYGLCAKGLSKITKTTSLSKLDTSKRYLTSVRDRV